MKKIISGLCVLVLLASACGDIDTSSGGGGDAEVPTVKTEFLNPSEDTLYVRVFDHGGWIFNEPVPPASSITLDVEEGLFSVASYNTAGDMLDFYPRGMKPETLADTFHFGVSTDPEDNSQSVRVKFESPKFYNIKTRKYMYTGRYAFDLTFDSTRYYPVADIHWMYGVEDEAKMRQEFLKVTKNGENFILSYGRGSRFMIFPEKCAGPFDPIPDEMTVWYNNKTSFPKVFTLPEGTPISEAANYLVEELILNF